MPLLFSSLGSEGKLASRRIVVRIFAQCVRGGLATKRSGAAQFAEGEAVSQKHTSHGPGRPAPTCGNRKGSGSWALPRVSQAREEERGTLGVNLVSARHTMRSIGGSSSW